MDLRDRLQAAIGDAYLIERELGGGGMSRVFVANERAYGRTVVIKVLPPELTQGVSVERFRREIQLAAQLQHPHIVPLLTSGEMDGLPYYVMPYVDGTSLRERLMKGGPLPVGEAATLLREVAKALAYAHERGVVHRDIKPDNVLITGGSAVVTDFGIAKALTVSKTVAPGGTLTQMGTSIGTPAYMAPEQAAGDPATDHRADLYSFACMAYEMLAGEPPFTSRAPQKLLAAHMAEAPRPVTERRTDTPPLLAALITRCLEKDPDRRPQGATELVKVLETVATTSGGTHPAMPAILLSGRPRLARVLVGYAAAFTVVYIVAKAAVLSVGLPTWVVPAATALMALGLPAILFTALVHHGAHRAATMANITPGGTPAVQGTMARIAIKASPWVTWRRTILGGVAAIGVLAATTGGYMMMRAYGFGPAASLMSTGAFGASERLIVADFKSPAADTSLGAVVTEAFRSDLAQSSNLSVMASTALQQVLERMQRPRDTRVDFALAREIATREGVKAVLDGEVLAIGGSYVIAAQLHAAQSGDVLASFRVTADDDSELIPAIGQLARDVRAKVGESLRTVNAAPPLEQVTTPSLAALRKYVQALRVFNHTPDYERGVALLEEAVAIDTSFAMAYRKIGVELANRGLDFDRARQAIDRAFANRDRLSDTERQLTIAAYHTYGSAPDEQKALDAYLALLEIDPRNGTALNNAGAAYGELRQYDKGEQMAARAFAVDPTVRVYGTNLWSSQVAQRKFAEAAQTLALIEDAVPGSVTALVGRTALLVGQERPDSAEALARATLRQRSGERVAARMFMEFLSNHLRTRGRLDESLAFDRRLQEMDAQDGVGVSSLRMGIKAAATQALFLEDPARAQRMLDESLRRTPLESIPPANRPLGELAELYAYLGHPERIGELGEMAQALARTHPSRGNRRKLAYVQGHLALARGNYAEAARSYRTADNGICTACAPARLARAFDLAGQPDSAIAALRSFQHEAQVHPPEPVSLFLAASHKRLGELLEAKGDRQGAATQYAKFIELWKRADPALQPKVAEVQQRLQRLRATELR